MADEITVLAEGEQRVPGRVDGSSVLVAAAALAAATGWEAKPEGLCRGPVCVPVRGPIERDGHVDLAALAGALDAPFAAEPPLGVAAIGEPAALRAEAMATLDAPDFTLARVGGAADGEPFTFSTIGRRKKVLVAWSSW